MTTFTPEQEIRRELVKIALFAAQELRAALKELHMDEDNLRVIGTLLSWEAHSLGLDPNNLEGDLPTLEPGAKYLMYKYAHPRRHPGNDLAADIYRQVSNLGSQPATLTNRVRTHDNQEGED